MLKLAWAYLRDRPFTTALNILLLAIAVAMLVLLLQFGTQARDRFERDARDIDLVVGAKGSPLQLILSSVFQVDQPTGNIPLSSLTLLRDDPAVARAVPLALGDNFDGFRIVGTDQTFLDLQKARVAHGRTFDAPMDAIIGASVAEATGAAIGQRFIGSHGLEHDEEFDTGHDHSPFRVVGILAPTGGVTDRLILTSVESVWRVHGIERGEEEAHDHQNEHADHAGEQHDHLTAAGPTDSDAMLRHAAHDAAVDGTGFDRAHSTEEPSGGAPALAPPMAQRRPALQERRTALEPELTALLVTYRNASGAIRIPAMINRQTDMQAAVPAIETARLLDLVGASLDGLRIFAWLLALTGGLAVFVALLGMARNREGDLALLRVMGASRLQVFATVVMEGLITAAIGSAIGWIVAHGLLGIAGTKFATLGDLGLTPWQPLADEALLVLGVLAIGVIASLLPAGRVYRLDPVATLARSQ